MYTRDPAGRHVPHSPTTLPLRPFRRRMGPPGAPPRVPGKARPSPEVAHPAHSRRRLLLRSGCAWRMLPKEYPPWQTVYYHFRKWRRDGRLRQAHERLRATLRESEYRDRDPSGAVLDSQVVKTTGVGGPERGLEQGPSDSRAGSATCSWTPVGWYSALAFTPPACTTTATARKGS